MAELSKRVERADTTFENILSYNFVLFASMVFITLILVVGGVYIAQALGGVLEYIFLTSGLFTYASPITSLLAGIIMFLYMGAIIIAVLYGLYALFNYLLLRVLRKHQVPRVENSCELHLHCYERSKWNGRVNKILLVVGLLLGGLFALVAPEFSNPYMVGITSVYGVILWVAFVVLMFGLPIYRLFVIISDVSFYALGDPTLVLRKKVLLTYTIIFGGLGGFFTGFLLYQMIRTGFCCVLYPAYIIGYVIIGGLLVPAIIFLIKYIQVLERIEKQ